MTNNPTIDGVSRDLLRKQFEEKNEHRGWFVPGGISETDTPEGFVYSDFTTDMCWTCYFEANAALQSTIARLEARIAELESGRGEIAGFRYRANGDWEWMDESPFADGRTHYKLGGEELQPLYAAPPAPVAVALPERLPMSGRGLMDAPTVNHHIGWNACLDATAALNNKPSTEVSQ